MGSKREVWNVSGGSTKSQAVGRAGLRVAPFATSAKIRISMNFISMMLKGNCEPRAPAKQIGFLGFLHECNCAHMCQNRIPSASFMKVVDSADGPACNVKGIPCLAKSMVW